MFQTIFKRYENKYLLSKKQYSSVLGEIKSRTIPDKFGQSDVCSIYYDREVSLTPVLVIATTESNSDSTT